MERKIFLLRTPLIESFDEENAEKWYKELFTNEYVGIGWNNVDFTQYPNDEEGNKNLMSALHSKYSLTAVDKVSITNFRNIRKGDYVIVTFEKTDKENTFNCAYLAIAQEERIYQESEPYSYPLFNRLKVIYLETPHAKIHNEGIPGIHFAFDSEIRKLSDKYQKELGTKETVIIDISEFNEVLEPMFNQSIWSDNYYHTARIFSVQFKGYLLQHLQTEIHKYVPKDEIMFLIWDLFTYEGYKYVYDTCESDKNPIVFLAERKELIHPLKFHVFFNCPEEKDNRNEETTLQLLRQIQEEKNKFRGEQIYFVTFDNVTTQLREQFGEIHILAGADIVELIIKYLDKMGNDNKMKLGICDSPMMAFIPQFETISVQKKKVEG